MQTSPLAFTDRQNHTADLGGDLNQPIADERCYSEQFVADLTDQHLQTLRRARRADAERGTPGERAPVPIWVNERSVRYQGRAIREWIAKRTAHPVCPAA